VDARVPFTTAVAVADKDEGRTMRFAAEDEHDERRSFVCIFLNIFL